MEKYSIDIQNEIESILNSLYSWRNLFSITIEHYIDGWAIYLKEIRAKPRLIIIFKSYEKASYSIRSSEIQFNDLLKNEEELELYKVENLPNQNILIKELKEVIYGKDLINFTSIKFKDQFNI